MSPAARRLGCAIVVLLALVGSGTGPVASAARASEPTRLKLPEVQAAAAPTDTGTVVTTRFVVANRTGKRQPGTRAELHLVSADRRFGLGSVPVPSLRAGATRTLISRVAAPARTIAGSYQVIVCLNPRKDGPCRTTSGEPVQILPAVLSASPGSLDLGAREPGSASPAQTVILTNTGHSRSGPIRTGLTGTDAADFSVDGGTCAANLLPGASCTVDVAFTPAAPGASSADLVVAGRSTTTPAGVPLTGTGLAPAALAVDPTTGPFADTQAGQSSTATTFTITNTGDVTSGVPTAELTGTDADQFTVTDDTCTTALAAEDTCTVQVTFDPTTPGDKTAQLTVDATPGGTTTADLTGTGLAPAALAVDPTTGPFADTQAGQSSTATTFTITNTGDVTSGVPTAELTGTDADQFTVTADTCTTALAAEDTCTVQVTFDPTTPGDKTAQLTVVATPGGTTTADLTGTGLGQPQLVVDRTTNDFGYYRPGQSSAATTFTVTNTGNASSGVVDTTLSGADADQFAVSSDTCSTALAAGATCTVAVGFSPTTQGDKTAELAVSDGSVEATSTLAGSATTQVVFFKRASIDIGSHAVGSTTPFVFELVNTTDQDLLVPLVSFANNYVGPAGTSATPTFYPDFGNYSCQVGTRGIPAHGTCTLGFTFTPPVAGAYSATIVPEVPGYSLSGSYSGVGVSETPQRPSSAGPQADATRTPAPAGVRVRGARTVVPGAR